MNKYKETTITTMVIVLMANYIHDTYMSELTKSNENIVNVNENIQKNYIQVTTNLQ